jgi:hypothetical protein
LRTAVRGSTILPGATSRCATLVCLEGWRVRSSRALSCVCALVSRRFRRGRTAQRCTMVS